MQPERLDDHIIRLIAGDSKSPATKITKPAARVSCCLPVVLTTGIRPGSTTPAIIIIAISYLESLVTFLVNGFSSNAT
jgi:hypothetical protein